MLPRIVITGMGIVSSAGTGTESMHKSLINGTSHTRTIDHFNTDHLSCSVGAPVLNFDAREYLNAHELKRLDRSAQFFVAAASMAIQESRYHEHSFNPNRIGVFEGSSLGGLESALEEHEILLQKGPRAINPFLINKAMNGIGGSMVALQNGIHGQVVDFSNGSVSSACAIINAFHLLQLQEIDLAIAGGSEAPINANMYSIFSRAGILTNQNEHPDTACRPFDATRNGLVLAEGGAALVMERLDSAMERGAKIYAEVLSTSITNDSYNLVAPAADAEQQSLAIKLVLQKAKMKPEQIDYISAHGTSTHLNDKTETLAIRKALGETADKIYVSAIKSMIGHSLGACSAVETASALISMENNFIPPVINLHAPDPECNLNYVANTSIQKEVNLVLIKNSSFGGKNTAILLRKFDGR